MNKEFEKQEYSVIPSDYEFDLDLSNLNELDLHLSKLEEKELEEVIQLKKTFLKEKTCFMICLKLQKKGQ